MLKKIIGQWKNLKEPQSIDWLFLGAIGALCFVSVIYFDILTTAPHGIHLWDTQIYNYYSKIREFTGYSAIYPIGIYLIFALWNLPVWLYAKLKGIIYMAAHSHPMQLTDLGTSIILYNKVLLILFSLWAAWLIFRILIEAKVPKGRAKWGGFVFLTSINTLSPVMLVSQYDILYIPFMLLGVLAFIRNKEKSFIGYFAIAVLMKGFSAFAFIPLLLLREKNIYKVAFKAAMSFLPYILLTLFFLLFDGTAYKEGLGFSKGVLTSRLLENTLGGGISFFIITYGLLCLYAHLRPPKDDKRGLLWQAAFLCAAAYGGFFMDTRLGVYWIVLLSPFTTLLIFSNPKKLGVNLLLETLSSFSLMLYYGNIYFWMFGIKQIQVMNIIPRLFPVSGSHPYTSLTDIIPDGVDPIYKSLSALGLIALVILNLPCKEYPLNSDIDAIERGIIWLRLAAFLPFIFGILFCYFYTGQPLGRLLF